MAEVKKISKREQDIIDNFSLFDTWEEKYEYLIDIGKKLEPLEEEYKKEENIVRGCQSTVWLVADYRDGLVYFKADSDAIIVKGLVNMLMGILSGNKPGDILEAKMDFLKEIGMYQHLAQTRSNGLVSMIKQMKNYAIAFGGVQTSKN